MGIRSTADQIYTYQTEKAKIMSMISFMREESDRQRLLCHNEIQEITTELKKVKDRLAQATDDTEKMKLGHDRDWLVEQIRALEKAKSKSLIAIDNKRRAWENKLASLGNCTQKLQRLKFTDLIAHLRRNWRRMERMNV